MSADGPQMPAGADSYIWEGTRGRKTFGDPIPVKGYVKGPSFAQEQAQFSWVLR